MTWSHPRGYDPMLAVSKVWRDETGIDVVWDKRSLQDFESYPVEDLARRYDLIVIDHPHVGQITAENCLLPLPEDPDITGSSVGASTQSYVWAGQRWAYPIDAAAQVQAIRPDLLDRPPRDWDEVISLARNGQVVLPLRAPHALMCFYFLMANEGSACRNDGGLPFFEQAAAVRALSRLHDVVRHISPACFDMDPIAALERLANDDRLASAPLIYGYISYSLPGFRDKPITFHDVPTVIPGGGVMGSALGGTGLAVSAFTAKPESATAFARFAAGSKVQSGVYVDAGGQAGHRHAWTDSDVDANAGGFYGNTLRTLDAAWVRPRHNGYMGFQNPASERISNAMTDGDFTSAAQDLLQLYSDTVS